MWHGASWNYIIWGLYYFLFLVIEKFVWKGFDKIPAAVRHVMVLAAVYFGWVIFKFENLGLLGTAIKGMFGLNHNAFHDMSASLAFNNHVFLLLVCVIAVTPLGKYIKAFFRNLGRQNKVAMWGYGIVDALIPVALLTVSMMALAGNSYNPFLYFQF